MADIKTRDAVKGTIKTIDKATIASERMKSAYVGIKEKAEQGYYADESSATEYATDRISFAADRVKDEGIHQFNKQGQKAVKTTQDNIGKAKDKITDFKQSRAAKAAEQKAAQNMSEQHGLQIRHGAASRSAAPDVSQTAKSQLIKTRQQGQKMIKTTARNTEKAVKATAKGTVKTTENGNLSKNSTGSGKGFCENCPKGGTGGKSHRKGNRRSNESDGQSHHSCGQGDYCRNKSSDFRSNCRWLDCSCDYSHCCPARLCRFPVWRRKRK